MCVIWSGSNWRQQAFGRKPVLIDSVPLFFLPFKISKKTKIDILIYLQKMHSGTICCESNESQPITKINNPMKRTQRRGKETKDADMHIVFLHWMTLSTSCDQPQQFHQIVWLWLIYWLILCFTSTHGSKRFISKLSKGHFVRLHLKKIMNFCTSSTWILNAPF